MKNKNIGENNVAASALFEIELPITDAIGPYFIGKICWNTYLQMTLGLNLLIDELRRASKEWKENNKEIMMKNKTIYSIGMPAVLYKKLNYFNLRRLGFRAANMLTKNNTVNIRHLILPTIADFLIFNLKGEGNDKKNNM